MPRGLRPSRTAPLTKEDRERAELRTKTYKALLDLYKRKPQSRKAIQNAFGYAVFVDTSYSVGLLGGGHGRGRAINQHSGRVAAAGDGVNGDALEGSFQVAPGMWMYQVTTKGLAADLTVKGTRFYVDKDLNVNTVVK
mgnify:CR=1 FL=1